MVGRTMTRATPSINTVKRRAATIPTRRADRRENMNMVREKAKKRRSGIPVRAI